jgi:hypothetical protein
MWISFPHYPQGSMQLYSQLYLSVTSGDFSPKYMESFPHYPQGSIQLYSQLYFLAKFFHTLAKFFHTHTDKSGLLSDRQSKKKTDYARPVWTFPHFLKKISEWRALKWENVKRISYPQFLWISFPQSPFPVDNPKEGVDKYEEIVDNLWITHLFLWIFLHKIHRRLSLIHELSTGYPQVLPYLEAMWGIFHRWYKVAWEEDLGTNEKKKWRGWKPSYPLIHSSYYYYYIFYININKYNSSIGLWITSFLHKKQSLSWT